MDANSVRAAAKGDQDAFAMFVREYKPKLYKIAWSILGNDADVADALQETIIACWNKLPQLRKPESFDAWVTKILVNTCRSMLREHPHAALDDLPSQRLAVSDSYDFEWQDLLASLDEKYRLVIMLYYGAGFRAREIAQILGLSTSTVTTRLERARRQLRSQLEEGK